MQTLGQWQPGMHSNGVRLAFILPSGLVLLVDFMLALSWGAVAVWCMPLTVTPSDRTTQQPDGTAYLYATLLQGQWHQAAASLRMHVRQELASPTLLLIEYSWLWCLRSLLRMSLKQCLDISHDIFKFNTSLINMQIQQGTGKSNCIIHSIWGTCGVHMKFLQLFCSYCVHKKICFHLIKSTGSSDQCSFRKMQINAQIVLENVLRFFRVTQSTVLTE